MTIFIASDIHGSSANIERFYDIVKAYRVEHPDTKVVLLGDIYNHGPRNPLPEGYAPMKVAERLNSEMEYLSAIKGNCDSEVDQMISNFDISGDFSIEWQGRTVFFTHGHKCNPELPPQNAKEGDIVFFGHRHIQWCEKRDGVTYICVGAIGMPLKDVERSYATLDEDKIQVKSLVGDKVLLEVKL